MTNTSRRATLKTGAAILTFTSLSVGSTRAQSDTTNPEVVDQIPSPANGTQGLATEGEYIWTVHGPDPDNIFKIDKDGTIQESYYHQVPKENGIDGVAHDGNHLYINHYDESITQIDTESNETVQYTAPGEVQSGLDYRNDRFLQSSGTEVSLMDTNMNKTRGVPLAESMNIGAAAFGKDRETIFIGDFEKNIILEQNTNGEALEKYSAPSNKHLTGLKYNNSELYASFRDDQRIYVLNTDVSTPTNTPTATPTPNPTPTPSRSTESSTPEVTSSKGQSNEEAIGFGVLTSLAALFGSLYMIRRKRDK